MKLRRIKYSVNKDFFKVWSSNMAYILGFTCADGNVYKNTLSWDLADKFPSNKQLLIDFNGVFQSNYIIDERRNSVRLRINNKDIISDLNKLGIVPNKNKILKLPNVPNKFFKDFARGFLDGDGWIAIRKKNNSQEFCVGFSNGSFELMNSFVKTLHINLNFISVNLRKREKISKKGFHSIYYQIDFYSVDAMNIIRFLFDGLNVGDLYLKRKFEKQLLARKIFDSCLQREKKGYLWFELEKKFSIDLNVFLEKSLKRKLPRDIAKDLDVSLSTVYRLLDRSGIRKMSLRGSQVWKNRILEKRLK